MRKKRGGEGGDGCYQNEGCWGGSPIGMEIERIWDRCKQIGIEGNRLEDQNRASAPPEC